MPTHPIIAIAYDDSTRKTLENSLSLFQVKVVPCSTFSEAENLMLNEIYQGIVVDLTSMVKAKGEEKSIACSLTGFFPTLRVRAMGPMIIPMAMSGDARQDKSLADFLSNSCRNFVPRRLRSHKRRELFIPAVINMEMTGNESRLCSLNVSWGGMFLIDMNCDRYEINQHLSIFIPEFGLKIETAVIWINRWGNNRKAPGLGVAFKYMDQELENMLTSLLKTSRQNDRDRLLA